MSFVPERRHLLPSSQQSTSYDTFVAPAEGDGSASAVSTDQCEGQSSTLEGQQELVQNHIFQISSEATEDREPVQQRNILSYLCSFNPLRYLIIAFGLWSEMGRCSMYFIIPVVIVLTLPVEIYLALNVECNVKGNNFEGGYDKRDLDLWISQSMELLSYLLMAFSVRKLRKHRQAICLSQAFRLAKTIWLNFILLVSVCLIVLSVVTRNYSIPQDGLLYIGSGAVQYEIWGVKNQKIYLRYLVWRLISSVVTWQPVICCLLFDVIMKALATLVDQCLKRIITIRAESVKYYIQIHQEICCKAESTFSVFKVWLTFNVLAFIFLLFWNGIRKSIALIGTYRSFEFFRSLCYGPNLDDSLYDLVMWYYLCTLLLYILFNVYFPWRSMACLRHSFSHLVQVLNDKTDWDPEHPFNDRFNLNCFIQYANIAQRRPFMNFTFRSIIPYLSILLAVCGISLALYHQFENEGHR